jgi:hypothetical protein
MEDKLKPPFEPFTPEMLTAILHNTLMLLTVEQRASLCVALYSRSGLRAKIESEIEVIKSKRKPTDCTNTKQK